MKSIIFSAVKPKKILNGLLTLYNRTYNETKTLIKNVFDIARRKKKHLLSFRNEKSQCNGFFNESTVSLFQGNAMLQTLLKIILSNKHEHG